MININLTFFSAVLRGMYPYMTFAALLAQEKSNTRGEISKANKNPSRGLDLLILATGIDSPRGS